MTVNFDGHIQNPVIMSTLREIKEKAAFMRFLGSYKKAKPLMLN